MKDIFCMGLKRQIKIITEPFNCLDIIDKYIIHSLELHFTS